MKIEEKTLVVWHRLGKEHGERQGFRVNSAETVHNHIEEKVREFSAVSEHEWRWWQLNDEVIIEKPPANAFFSEGSMIYYLPKKNWALIGDVRIPNWHWYIHIASFDFSERFKAWIMTDLFADVLVARDGKTHSVLDLDELADAERIGLISREQLHSSLAACQELVDLIRRGEFPPRPVVDADEFLKLKGWK